MAPSRRFPASIPIRRSLGRKGIVTTVLDHGNYYVDWGRGEAELSILLGEEALSIGDPVRGWLNAEGDVWRIKQPDRVYDAYTYVYFTTYPPTTFPVAPGGVVHLHIREILPHAAQATRPWDNFPRIISTVAGDFHINHDEDGNWPSGKIAIAMDLRFSPDGTQVAMVWKAFDYLDNTLTKMFITRWAVNSQAERTWGDEIETADLGVLLGNPGGEAGFDATYEGQGLGWSADGEYLSLMVGNIAGGGPRNLMVLGGGNSASLYLADYHFRDEIWPYGPSSMSPDGTLVVWSKFPQNGVGFSGNDYAYLYSFDRDTETLSFTQFIEYGPDVPLSQGHARTFQWTPDGQYFFMGIQSSSNDATLIAYPINPDGTLGAPIPEPNSANPLSGNTLGIDLHSDGINMLVNPAVSDLWVIPFENGAWGTRSTPIIGAQWNSQVYWLDDAHMLTQFNGVGVWRPPPVHNTSARLVGLTEADSPIDATVGHILKYPRPPRGVKARLRAPNPNTVPAVDVLAH